MEPEITGIGPRSTPTNRRETCGNEPHTPTEELQAMSDVNTIPDAEETDRMPRKSRQPKVDRRVFVYRLLDGKPKRIERELERDIAPDRSMAKGKPQTLVQFIRSEGGINIAARTRRGRKSHGELENFTVRQSGQRGLVTTVKGKGRSLDYMHQAATAAGFPVTSPDALLDAMDNEIRGGKKTYATHGHTDYRDNPKSDLYIAQLGKTTFAVYLKTYLLKKFKTRVGAENYMKSIRAKAKAKTNPSASRLAKAAISVFDNDLDLDVDTRDVRRLQKGERLIKAKGKRQKKNPLHPITAFAGLGSGILSALQIKQMLNKPTTRKRRKTNGTTKAKRRNPATKQYREVANIGRTKYTVSYHDGHKTHKDGSAFFDLKTFSNKKKKDEFVKGLVRQGYKENPQGGLFSEMHLLTIYDRNNKVKAVYLTDGKKIEKKFRTAAAARTFAKKSGISVVENPAKTNGIVSRYLGRRKAAKEYAKELRLEAAIKRSRKRRSKAESKAKGNPKKAIWKNFWVTVIEKSTGNRLSSRNVLSTESKRTVENKERRFWISKGYKLKDVLVSVYEGDAAKFNPKSKIQNPNSAIPHRRTFEMFQGREATTQKALPVSRHAPARLDQLGDLIEMKLHTGRILKFNPKTFKLCASGGKLWIAGGKIAKPNPASKANGLDAIDAIDHVVYGTYKPHHGDNVYTHYIHKLGEESGVMPILAADRDGFPIIRGGRYKIEARGIVD